MFRIYLKEHSKRARETVRTHCIDTAKAVFADYVNRRELDATNAIAVISRHAIPIAEHRFDANEDDKLHYWRGRVVDLNIRKDAGRPIELEDGKRVNMFLDQTSIDTAKRLGAGNLSEGVRKSLAKSASQLQPD